MEHIDKMNSNQLLKALQTTDKYAGLTQKQIVEQIGSNSVYTLRPALKQVLSNPTFFPSNLRDVIPNIIENLDAITKRALNKALYNQHTNKDLIYQFIITHYDTSKITDFSSFFENQDAFNNYQRELVERLDEETVYFLMYYIYLINNQSVEQMSKFLMSPSKTIGFALYNDKILIMHNYEQAEGTLTFTKKSKKINQNIVTFIKNYFDVTDYDMLIANKIIEPVTFNFFMKLQSHTLKYITDDMTKFLEIYTKFISDRKIRFSSISFKGYIGSGFIFLNNRLVAFSG
jgi:hypothetical protein